MAAQKHKNLLETIDNVILIEALGLGNVIYVFRPLKKNKFCNEYTEIKVTCKDGSFLKSTHKLKVIEQIAVDKFILEMIKF